MIPLLEIWYATIMHFSFRCIQSEDQYLLSAGSDTTSVKIKLLRLKCDLFWVRKNWCHSWKIITYSWVPNRRPPRPCQLNFWFSSAQDIFTPTPLPPIPPAYWLLVRVSNSDKLFETTYLCWLFCDLVEGTTRLYWVLFCKFVWRRQHIVFCFAS